MSLLDFFMSGKRALKSGCKVKTGEGLKFSLNRTVTDPTAKALVAAIRAEGDAIRVSIPKALLPDDTALSNFRDYAPEILADETAKHYDPETDKKRGKGKDSAPEGQAAAA